MNLSWEIEKNIIFGYNDKILDKSNNIKSVYIFDLDYTLIKTKSGKKFPIDKSDWNFLFPQIPNELSKKLNCLIGIITNQKGLKSQLQIMDWIDKIKDICKFIQIDFIFASLLDDRFRKPMCGSWDFIKNKIINIDWCKLYTKNKIYYIGDAFGRINDFSDTDIKFAINCGLKYKTPEIFFHNNNNNNTCSITYPTINYFTNLEQKKIFDELETIIKSHSKIFIITIGLPASGKSFLRKELIKKFPQFSYFNCDDIHNNIQSNILIKKLSTKYNYLIDDNTNLNKLERNDKLKKFNEYYKIGIWFDYNLEICWHLNWLRMYWFGTKLLPKVSYHTLNKYFDKNDLDKGFDKFIKINKLFEEMNLDNKIKYYF